MATLRMGTLLPTYVGQSWPFNLHQGETAPVQVEALFDQTLSAIADLVLDNMAWFVALFLFFLAVRFGPTFLSWYRHRNDPKQMNLF